MGRAILIMFIGMSLIPAGDTAGKFLTVDHGAAPQYVAWSRFAIGTLLIAPFVGRDVWPLFRMPRIWVRAALLAAGITSIQTGLQTAPLADAFAAFFVGPIISYVLAALFLQERVTRWRSLAIATGFMGVLLVVRPGGAADPGVIWAFAAGCFYGCFLTLSRSVSQRARPIPLIFTQLSISAVLLAPFGMAQVPVLTGTVTGLTLVSALASMLGNLLLLYAYRLAPATRIAPLVYLQLIAAVMLGWALFGDLPDALTLAGLSLIIGAGVASARLR